MAITVTSNRPTLFKVATAQAGPFAVWKGLKTMDGSADSEIAEDRVFGETDVITSADNNVRTWSFDGLRDMTDTTGQEVVRTAYDSKATIYFQDLPNGTTGFTYPVLITSWNTSAATDNRNRTFSGDMRQNGPAVAVV